MQVDNNKRCKRLYLRYRPIKGDGRSSVKMCIGKSQYLSNSCRQETKYSFAGLRVSSCKRLATTFINNPN